ncbi:MAG: hypothetical protein WD894_26415 [Pirellulales bacterium]
MRFSITTLLLATAVTALGSAAVVHRTSLWTNLVVTLAYAITLGCTITAWAAPIRRTFCVPFAIVAWVYLATIYLDPLAPLEKQLLTSRLIHDAFIRIDSTVSDVFYEDRDDVYVRDLNRRLEGLAPARFHAFYHAWQAIIALGLATLSGLITSFLLQPRTQPPPP